MEFGTSPGGNWKGLVGTWKLSEPLPLSFNGGFVTQTRLIESLAIGD